MWTITSLTLREALRKRAFIATLFIMVIMYALSFLPGAFKSAFQLGDNRFEIGIGFTILFGMDVVKFFSSVLAIILCAGAITGEIERGYLSVILPKPVRRLEIYFGKWLGVMLFCFLNALVWTALLWISMNLQSAKPHHEMWRMLPPILIYPMLYGTIALAGSTFAAASLTSMFTVALGAFAYFSNTLLDQIARAFDIQMLQKVVYAAEWILPMARLTRIVLEQVSSLLTLRMMRQFEQDFSSQWYDLPYLGAYILAWFILGAFIFQRKDIQ
jgi:ABC-type transport system involved in multi-copper enzyme maturation permease subunit